MIRVKVCGLTRADDVDAALAAGADMLGFIHVPGSPRYLDEARLARLLAHAGTRAQRVVVVRDLPGEDLARLRRELVFEHFQFHGGEDAVTVKRHGGFKVVPILDRPATAALLAAHDRPILLDTAVGGSSGGTGVAFDWSRLREVAGPVIVAGGLRPDNVEELVRRYRPWGVDVSSGVESAPGIKDHDQVRRFIDIVRSACHEQAKGV